MDEFELMIETPLQELLGKTKVTFLARATTYLITYEINVRWFLFVYKATHKKLDKWDLSKYDKMYQREYDKFISNF